MALFYTTTATRKGAINLNRASRTFAADDLGGKLQALISSVNQLQSAVSMINALLISANLSGVGFSAISGAGAGNTSAVASTMAALSNFRA